MSLPMKKISIVIPVFNEATNIVKLYDELIIVLSKLDCNFEFIFVDDGSTDKSLSVIKELVGLNHNIFFIELSKNFGHQYALKAGLDFSTGDAVITMDSDLQHPPKVIIDLVTKWREGYDIVYTLRKDDKKLPWFKRTTSRFFYSLLNNLSGLKLEEGTADFRLMGRNVVNAIIQLKENELFIRGLVKWAGFHQISVTYDAHDRYSGKSKYSLGKMVSFGFRAITSFSVKPLKLIAYTGLLLFTLSLILIPYALISYFLGNTISGWTSIMITIIFFGSLQLLMLGIIGLYLSKIAIQSKQRPLYLVRDTNYAPQLQHEPSAQKDKSENSSSLL